MKKQESPKKIENKLGQCFEGCLYFTAGRLYRTVERLAFEAFKPLALAPTHAFLLMALDKSPKNTASPSVLAQVLNLDPSTVTRLIAVLQKDKLVQVSAQGRSKSIELTAKGLGLMPQVREAWGTLGDRFNDHFGAKNSRAISEAINKWGVG